MSSGSETRAGSLERGRYRYFPVVPGRVEFAIRQAHMGHGTVQMTMHYTRTDLELRRTSIGTMTGLLVEQHLESA